ncbi:hypothetical protein ACFT2C_13580 [Promicromonospora sp. NPDC057138]|uniref:hypothetical protein n=1 Tax=Promicromonospora sp. NPDC057138 TaxID=3346031 RepID=UPI0036457B36
MLQHAGGVGQEPDRPRQDQDRNGQPGDGVFTVAEMPAEMAARVRDFVRSLG